MNQLVSIDVATLTPATVFATGGMEGIVSKLEAEVRAIDRDISTHEGREAVKSLAYKVARSKTALDDMGKDLVAGIKKQAGAIDADRKLARDRLDALKEEVRGPLTAWEDAEAARVDGHERALVAILESSHFAATVPSANLIRQRLEYIAYLSGRDWQEFEHRGIGAYQESRDRLTGMLANAEQAERDAAELAELRRLKAEREEADRIAAAAAQAAEKARQESEQKAAREAAEAEQRAEWQRKREEQAERDVQAAVAAALAADRRVAEQKAAAAAAKKAAEEAAERKRQENKRHRQKIEKDVYTALLTHGINDPATAAHVVAVIAAGEIPHVSITY